ncbi:hypothetical protein KUCAC02_016410, partial [Chaenocephalus aceratus]
DPTVNPHCRSAVDSEPDDGTEVNEEMLYPGATVTQGLLAVTLFALRHHLTGAALSDLLGLIHLLVPNLVPASKYLFKKFFGDPAVSSVAHFYCEVRQHYIGKDPDEGSCSHCGTSFNSTTSANRGNFFLAIALKDLLKDTLENHAFCQITGILESEGLTYPEVEHPEVEKLHFMVDMTGHLNMLNLSLQGKGSTALQMLEDVMAFEPKMTVLLTEMCRKTAFGQRFSEFRKGKNTLSFPVTPLVIDPAMLNMSPFTGVSQPDLEIELADIADKELWVSKFKSLTADLEDVARQKAILAREHKWSDLEILPKPDTYMKNLPSCVKIKVTSYSPDIEKLSSDVQKQKSH